MSIVMASAPVPQLSTIWNSVFLIMCGGLLWFNLHVSMDACAPEPALVLA